MITIILTLSIRWFVCIMSLELINTCSSYCMVDLIGTEPSLIKCTYRDIHILYLKLAIDFFSLFLLELILTPLSLCYLSYHQAWLLKWKRNDKFNAQISTKENQYRKKKGSRESDRNWRDRHSLDRELWFYINFDPSLMIVSSYHWDLGQFPHDQQVMKLTYFLIPGFIVT